MTNRQLERVKDYRFAAGQCPDPWAFAVWRLSRSLRALVASPFIRGAGRVPPEAIPSFSELRERLHWFAP